MFKEVLLRRTEKKVQTIKYPIYSSERVDIGKFDQPWNKLFLKKAINFKLTIAILSRV